MHCIYNKKKTKIYQSIAVAYPWAGVGGGGAGGGGEVGGVGEGHAWRPM